MNDKKELMWMDTRKDEFINKWMRKKCEFIKEG